MVRARVTGMARATTPGLAPAQRQPDQQGDRQHGDGHVVEQFIGFFLGGLPVIAGDGHLDVVGQFAAAQSLNAVQHPLGHVNGIGAFALGQR